MGNEELISNLFLMLHKQPLLHTLKINHFNSHVSHY